MNAFNPYLADVYASMSLPPAGPPVPNMSSAAAPPPPAPMAAPPPGNPFAMPAGGLDAPISLPSMPAMPQQAAPPPGPPPAPGPEPGAPPPPPPPQGAPGPSMGAPLGIDVAPSQFPLQQVGGSGVIPAHEQEMRGPTLRRQQGVMNATAAEAIGDNTANTQTAAGREQEMYLAQERDARAREAAAQQSMAERDEELAMRQQDFTTSVKALSKASVDPDRFWASKSTGSKIGAMISLALGGFLQGVRGGSNPGMDIINNAIERDIKAQEFAYHATRDTAMAKQTAFGMAMQKYQNVDAARAMARAAALDSAQAQFGQNAALWKDTESANRANAAMAELEGNKTQQIAQGIRFLPAQSTGRRWVDEHGISYSEDQARTRADTFRANNEKRDEIGLNTAGDVIKEGAKGEVAARTAAQKDFRAEMVTLPNGDEIRAPNAQEATTLRGIATGVNGANQLVAEARDIRRGTAWRIPGTSERVRLQQIQGELQVSTKDRASLGALSGPDMGLVNSMIGDLTSQSPTVDKTIDSFAQHTNNALRSRVRTIPGTPDTAQGKMPKSFTAHGGK